LSYPRSLCGKNHDHFAGKNRDHFAGESVS